MTVLVAYASKRGATAEIAQAIAQTLRESGLGVDCSDVAEVESLEGYDAVVLGSAVYIKRWRGDAKHFLRKHADALAQRPLWVFSSGPTGDPNAGAMPPEWMEPQSIVEKVERLGAREHVVFGGRLPVDSRLPAHRAMVQSTPPEYRDRRDWGVIKAWAAGIATQLHTAAPTR